ncbi:MAG: hypothetical protein V1774_10085 [Candidatus Eisenbacteria bacterium]
MRSSRRISSRALPPTLAVLFTLIALLISPSCTSEPDVAWEVHSLDEARALAAERQAVILVDFWRHN